MSNLTPELREQIDTEAARLHPLIRDVGKKIGYKRGATEYAEKWQEEKVLRERYEKALKEILDTNHDNYEKVIMKVKQIANEALTHKTSTDDTIDG